jgi:hypothetical protein
MPILNYGARTWWLIKSQMESFRVTKRAMERSILGSEIKDKINNNEIRERTQTKDIGYITKKNRSSSTQDM